MPQVDQDQWPDYGLAAFFVSVMIGHVLFGIDALRRRLLPRWNVMPVLVGLPTLLLIVPTLVIQSSMHRDFEAVLTTTFLRLALTGICWVLLGLVMTDRKQEPEPAPAVGIFRPAGEFEQLSGN